MDVIKASGKPAPFLTLTTTSVNGWYMAICPEFEVSACGSDPHEVVLDLKDMVRRNAFLYLKEKDSLPKENPLLKWSELIASQADISDLFRTTTTE